MIVWRLNYANSHYIVRANELTNSYLVFERIQGLETKHVGFYWGSAGWTKYNVPLSSPSATPTWKRRGWMKPKRPKETEEVAIMIKMTNGKKCEYEGCNEDATVIAMGHHHPLGAYCKHHSKVISEMSNGEFDEECPNCGCKFPVN